MYFFQDVAGRPIPRFAQSLTYIEGREIALIVSWGETELKKVTAEPT